MPGPAGQAVVAHQGISRGVVVGPEPNVVALGMVPEVEDGRIGPVGRTEIETVGFVFKVPAEFAGDLDDKVGWRPDGIPIAVPAAGPFHCEALAFPGFAGRVHVSLVGRRGIIVAFLLAEPALLAVDLAFLHVGGLEILIVEDHSRPDVQRNVEDAVGRAVEGQDRAVEAVAHDVAVEVHLVALAELASAGGGEREPFRIAQGGDGVSEFAAADVGNDEVAAGDFAADKHRISRHGGHRSGERLVSHLDVVDGRGVAAAGSYVAAGQDSRADVRDPVIGKDDVFRSVGHPIGYDVDEPAGRIMDVKFQLVVLVAADAA